MKNQLLLPRYCRMIGIILLIPSIALFIAYLNFNFEFSFLNTTPPKKSDLLGGNNNLTDEMAIAGVILSLFMIAFSRLRREDEYIRFIRLQSLQIGVYVNYAVFLLLTFTVYGGNYLAVLFYNIATVLILFILTFNFNLYIKPKFSKTLPA